MELNRPVENLGGYPIGLFQIEAHGQGWKFFRDDHWIAETGEPLVALTPDSRLLYSNRDDEGNGWQSIIAEPDGIVHLYMYGSGTLYLHVAAQSWDDADRIIGLVRKFVPELPKDDTKVSVSFWSLHPQNGPMHTHRMIKVPSWEEIRDNYTADVQEEMDALVSPDFEPGDGGQLILWEGEPGTGKTTALRALAREWRDWAKIEYITDPEDFFGKSHYMSQVVTQYGVDDPKWHVLVLEDAGELLSKDAKQRTGQAVSRLLNLVDGLIGQGLKLLVLVTTNEPIKGFHEAIARPGRAAAHIEFERLDSAEVEAWLERHGLETSVAPLTLAELYGELHDRKGAKKSKGKTEFGFGT